jgi:hypothetical protein
MRLRATLLSVLILAPRIETAAQEYVGVVTGNFPVADAAGKRIKFSGYIKTERVTGGNAALWWRADEGQTVVAANNWMNDGARNTSDWRRFEVSLSMPRKITNISFGLLHTGTGTAWFADLRIEIDKKPYTNERFDLGLTSAVPRGFRLYRGEYEFDVDTVQRYNGRSSFRIRRAQ